MDISFILLEFLCFAFREFVKFLEREFRWRIYSYELFYFKPIQFARHVYHSGFACRTPSTFSILFFFCLEFFVTTQLRTKCQITSNMIFKLRTILHEFWAGNNKLILQTNIYLHGDAHTHTHSIELATIWKNLPKQFFFEVEILVKHSLRMKSDVFDDFWSLIFKFNPVGRFFTWNVVL